MKSNQIKYITKMTKDLQFGDSIYTHKFSISGSVVGINLLGKVVELGKPFDGMGLIGMGVSQGMLLYNSKSDKCNWFTSFEKMPFIVGVEDE